MDLQVSMHPKIWRARGQWIVSLDALGNMPATYIHTRCIIFSPPWENCECLFGTRSFSNSGTGGTRTISHYRTGGMFQDQTCKKSKMEIQPRGSKFLKFRPFRSKMTVNFSSPGFKLLSPIQHYPQTTPHFSRIVSICALLPLPLNV